MKLYHNEVSPPSRAVLLTAKALGLEMETQEVDLENQENLTPEFLEMNPQHTIPTLEDEDFIIWDSHAIAGYLVGKYSSDDSLYPKEPKKRALVDQRLHFDSGILFPRVHNLVFPIVILDEKEISKEKLSAINEAYTFLNKFLESSQYIAGDDLTIADFCCVATVSTATIIIPISAERYPNLSRWYHLCKNLPYYDEANGRGLQKLDSLVESKLGKPMPRDL